MYHVTNHVWPPNFTDKGWRCQEEVREKKLVLLSSSYLPLFVCLGWCPFGNAECLIRPRKDFARIMNVEALVVLCGQF
jgi:hypothetical protein